MATRNPLNQRYQGDGPSGQSRKSATSAKPAAKAAASVRIKKKPVTAAEKRAYKKDLEKEAQRKAKEKAEKEAEKAKAAGIVIEEPKQKPIEKVGEFFGGSKKSKNPNVPNTPEYRKWRKAYWILVFIGIVVVVFSFIASNQQLVSPSLLMVFIIISYGVIIAAFVIDFRKVRPLVKQHKAGASDKKTAKVLKHEQEKKEQADAIEAARKAVKAQKKEKRINPKNEAAVDKYDKFTGWTIRGREGKEKAKVNTDAGSGEHES